MPGARPRPRRESFSGGSIRRRLRPALAAQLRTLARRATAQPSSWSPSRRSSHSSTVTRAARYPGRLGPGQSTKPGGRGGDRNDRQHGRHALPARRRPESRELLRGSERPRSTPTPTPTLPSTWWWTHAATPRSGPLTADPGSFLLPRLAPRGRTLGGPGYVAQQIVPNGTAKADLNVVGITAADGGLTFVWEHSDLLDDAAVDRLAGHHERLLEQFVERPDARLSELDLLGSEERLELERLSTNTGSFDREATIVGLVAAQARRAPEATAVVDGTAQLTYRELLGRAVGVASALREREVERGDRVGVLLGRGADAVVAQLGVLTAGAAYVPLDPQHPPARIAAILKSAGAEIALTDGTLRQRLPVGVAALEISGLPAGKTEPPDGGAPEDLAYVIYTSGSTGSRRVSK